MGRKKKTQPESKPEKIMIAGQNGEIEEVRQMGGVKSFKHVPELDDPVPQEILDKWKNRPVLPEGQNYTVGPDLNLVPIIPAAEAPIEYNYMRMAGKMQGQTCHVIGAGPSAKRYFSQLENYRNTISVNGVPLVFKSSYWYCCDSPRPDFLTCYHMPDMIKFVTETWDKIPDNHTGVYRTKTFPRVGPVSKPERSGLFHGKSAVIGAIECARIMGANRIIIWGVDYNNTKHSYDEVAPNLIKKEPEWEMPLIDQSFDAIAKQYPEWKIELYNANPESMLGSFPKIDPGKALSL